MPHTCDVCIITCQDFRLHQRADGSNLVAEYARSLGADCDLITRGGGIQDLVRPKLGHEDALLRDVTISVQLHQSKEVHIINHECCGAYGDFDFADREAEIKQHIQDMRDARDILQQHFPDIVVRICMAELADDSDGQFAVRVIE